MTNEPKNIPVEQFNKIINNWIESIHQYSYAQLTLKPVPEYWSAGQLYMHIINETRYYFEQVRICLLTNDNENKTASALARTMFDENAFPDGRIQGDPMHANIPQPESRKQLLSDLTDLKAEMNNLASKIPASRHTGKTKHPGLNYFNASEWMQFAEMHFRHHETQKERIDSFLKTGIFVL